MLGKLPLLRAQLIGRVAMSPSITSGLQHFELLLSVAPVVSLLLPTPPTLFR
jgi:hypothetical protein